MCDASDFTIEVVLVHIQWKVSHPIYYARNILIKAQINYTATEKELLAVIFTFEKSKAYLVDTKVVVYTDHATIKYLLDLLE